MRTIFHPVLTDRQTLQHSQLGSTEYESAAVLLLIELGNDILLTNTSTPLHLRETLQTKVFKMILDFFFCIIIDGLFLAFCF